MNVIIVGGGIAGLAFALGLKQRGIDSQVFEAAPELKPLGVGITLLPHAMRELSALGLEPALREVAIENRYHKFFNRHGQWIYEEPRGKFAGYPYPEFGIHRGLLHMVLLEAVNAQLGAARIARRETSLLHRRRSGDDRGVTVVFPSRNNDHRPPARIRRGRYRRGVRRC